MVHSKASLSLIVPVTRFVVLVIIGPPRLRSDRATVPRAAIVPEVPNTPALGAPVAQGPERTTVSELVSARAHDPAPGLRFEDRSWSWSQVVAESRRRAWLAATLAGSEGPAHIGVLLDNVPEYLFWLAGAALAGAVVVGINPTRRGEELARDIRFTDCAAVVTDEVGGALLDGLDLGLRAGRLLRVDTPAYAARLDDAALHAAPVRDPEPSDLLLLLFTSGTTGAPKAVRCTQGRLAAIAARAAAGYGFGHDEVCYCPMPLFHGNAVMALWAPAMAVGACVALPRRFSASRFLDDVRRFGATRFTYVGKALAYVLATPEHDDDHDNALREGFGTEASARDRPNSNGVSDAAWSRGTDRARAAPPSTSPPTRLRDRSACRCRATTS